MGTYNNVKDAEKEIMENITKVCIGAAIQTFNNIVVETPVDTGRARGNWQVSINTPITSIVTNPNGDIDVSRVLSAWKLTDIAYLTNNLPYIEPLELGWSDQRPNGWVRTNIAKGQTALNDKVKELDSK